ncbi:class I SAM-dependent methyltransferase, partial [Desulfobacterota bacterium AH_259_B03_O07]|nr:class I SAM-dependent methyltransferase [Desulfobacterota bacterium AH_259_B03_O07]
MELINKKRTLVAIDFSYDSLKKVKDKTNRLCADANELPVKNESIDCVIATDELICSESVEPLKLISESYRVLRPGGLLILEYDTIWCLDTFWMLLDSYLGNRIGYKATKNQMIKLFKSSGSSTIKWGIPKSDVILETRLFTNTEIKSMLIKTG